MIGPVTGLPRLYRFEGAGSGTVLSARAWRHLPRSSYGSLPIVDFRRVFFFFFFFFFSESFG
jgi:hypothetical protein